MRTVLTVLLLGALLPGIAAAQAEIVGWGSQVVVGESALTDLIAVAAGDNQNLGLRADGSIVAWGNNQWGQCNVPTPNTGFVAVAVGNHHSLGLKADGSIVAWGDCDGNWACEVPEPNTAFVAISATKEWFDSSEWGYSLGLKADGSIVAWGWDQWGGGNVPEPNADFVAVSAGRVHCLGLKADGSIVTWGYWYGGDPPAPNSGFVAISAGCNHNLGLRADGSIVAWGSNGYGECDVPAPNSGFVGVAAGGEGLSLGLKADGSIVAWGDNYYGQCNVPEPNTAFVAVAAGDWHSVGIKADGSIVAWGLNTYSQCNVPAPNTGFVSMAAGGKFIGPTVNLATGHSLGLKADGSIVAWGSGPGDPPAPNADFIAVAAAGRDWGIPYSLGLKADGSVVGWGGVPGGDPSGYVTDGVAVAAARYHFLVLRADGTVVRGGEGDVGGWLGGSPYVAVAAGGSGNPGGHSLGLRSDGSIAAVGSNNAGQCNVPEPNENFVAVAAGWEHSLGLNADGTIVAWGAGPGDPPPPNTGFVAVAAGGDPLVGSYSLGLKADGSIVAWGNNWYNQCDLPVPNTGFVAIAASSTHSLALYDPAGVRVEQPWDLNPDQDLQKPPTVQVINQPNPFNPSTEIRYWMERADAVTVSVFDLRGHEVCVLVNEAQPAGWNAVRWDGRDAAGRNVPTGVYFARMETESRVVSCRMMLVR